MLLLSKSLGLCHADKVRVYGDALPNKYVYPNNLTQL